MFCSLISWYADVSYELEKTKQHLFIMEQDIRKLDCEMFKQQKYVVGMFTGLSEDLSLVRIYPHSINLSRTLPLFATLTGVSPTLSPIKTHRKSRTWLQLRRKYVVWLSPRWGCQEQLAKVNSACWEQIYPTTTSRFL